MSLVFIFEKGSSVSASKYLGSLVFKYVGSEQVLAGGLPGEGCEGEDRRNSWINIAPSSPPPTTLIPSPNHYRQDGGGASFVCLCSTPAAYTSVFQTLLKVFKQ